MTTTIATDEQLERAARNLCEKRNFDPDEKITANFNPFDIFGIFTQSVSTERWRLALIEIQDLVMKMESLEEIICEDEEDSE